MSEIKILSPEDLRRMQLLMLDMLVDFDRVCRKYDIRYVIVSGTLLGAVRHKGFIPWEFCRNDCRQNIRRRKCAMDKQRRN